MLLSFLLLLQLLISRFNLLWSDRMQSIISVVLCVLSLALGLSIWPTLERVPCNAEKVYIYIYIWGEWSVKSFWLMISFSISICLLSFCVAVLSFGKSEIFKSPTASMWSSECDLSNISFTKLCVLCLGIDIKNCNVLLVLFYFYFLMSV